jgi:8-oxo-dGTP diphosphatase
MKLVEVAVGVVVKGNEVFVCLRPDDVHQGGKWEFPGGKVESSESAADALARELAEEIDIDVTEYDELIRINHDYGDKRVCLYTFLVTAYNGSPRGKEGQAAKWLTISELNPEDFPAANKAIIQALINRY